MKYHRPAHDIEAFQLTPESREDNSKWPKWMHEGWNAVVGAEGQIYPANYPNSRGNDELFVRTLHGDQRVHFGDWIIREDDTLRVISDERFKAQYSRAKKK